ncbi:MMPL family transporter [Nonomuraea recticatena]|uniref:MMPL family transporter n=1 Tax=Nonomuraea recticatena TaxID=46178 RepID=UPI00361AE9C9
MRTPVLYLVGVTAVLVSLALPFVDVKFGNVDHRVLPSKIESRQVAETVDADFARNSMAPIDVHVLVERDFVDADPLLPGPLGQGHTVVSPVTPVLPADVKPFADRLRRLEGVTGVDVTGFSQTNGSVRLAVRYEGDPMSSSARSVVTLIRSMTPEPNIRAVVVGGSTAAQMDLMDSLAATLPWMALVVCGATFVLLFAAFGSLLLPLKALLMNVLSIGASFGVIVWAFQYGNLASFLGFTPTGTIEATVTVLILAVVFGLSMDYELFLLSRVRAEWLRTGDNNAAVAAGLQKTGGIITSAALLLLVVIGAFSTAGITIVKLLGVGMFVAIVVDATLVRALLVPATMRLMGRPTGGYLGRCAACTGASSSASPRVSRPHRPWRCPPYLGCSRLRPPWRCPPCLGWRRLRPPWRRPPCLGWRRRRARRAGPGWSRRGGSSGPTSKGLAGSGPRTTPGPHLRCPPPSRSRLRCSAWTPTPSPRRCRCPRCRLPSSPSSPSSAGRSARPPWCASGASTPTRPPSGSPRRGRRRPAGRSRSRRRARARRSAMASRSGG